MIKVRDARFIRITPNKFLWAHAHVRAYAQGFEFHQVHVPLL
jgi:hypothetical protein